MALALWNLYHIDKQLNKTSAITNTILAATRDDVLISRFSRWESCIAW